MCSVRTELELILKALTKNELLAEADAWQALLRDKVIEIGKAEIAVKRQNREIEKAKKIQGQAREAKDQLKEIHDKTQEAKATGDVQTIEETEKWPPKPERRSTESRPAHRQPQRGFG